MSTITGFTNRSCPSCGLQVELQAIVCPRDGTSLTNVFQKDPGFSQYEFIENIGTGGMGVIYKARHLSLNKVVAIKMLHPHLVSPEALGRFQKEGQATSSLSHRNIINVQDFGVTQAGQAFMVMEYVNGFTLADLLQNEGQLSMPRFLQIFIQVCDALSHAHSRSILHRDIKPTNIMLQRNELGEEEVLIMDFGIAKIISDAEDGKPKLTKTGETIGSPPYLSPEQARGRKVDGRSDLYSLGCVMYESLCGSPPFDAKSAFDLMVMHLKKKPPPIREASLGNQVDPRLEKIIMRLLEKEPAARYQTMEALKTDLIYLNSPSAQGKLPSESGQKSEHTSLVSTMPGIDSTTSKTRIFAIIAAIVLLLACAFTVFFLAQSHALFAPR